MNAQTQISAAPQMNSVGLLNLESFELSQRIAKMLSSSTLVPEQYRATIQKKAGKDEYGNQLWREDPNPSGLSNCIIALNMSNRMGADPLMVMQNLYLVNGRPSWSSQFIMAGINSSGRFSALRFELEDLGEKEVEYTETIWENRKPKKVSKIVKIHDYSCVAWAIERETSERLESSKITIEMAVKEGWYTKDGSKWQTMPEQMLRYRAASFFGRVYAPELLMGLRSAEEEQDRIIDVTPDKVVSEQADANQLKREILGAKSPAALDEAEGKVLMLSDDAKREELLKLISAQAKKFQPATAAVSEKKPEQVKEEAPLAEAAPAKKPTSTEVKRDYLIKINGAESIADLNELHEQFIINESLTGPHLAHLKDAYTQAKKNLKSEQPPVQEAPVVNEIKSNGIAGGLKASIQDTANLDALTAIAQTIRDSKPKLTQDHLNDVLNVYAARKKFLEDQQDMFAGVPEVSFFDSALTRIRNAKSQDDINEVYADPAFDELSGENRERLDKEAQQRESELQD